MGKYILQNVELPVLFVFRNFCQTIPKSAFSTPSRSICKYESGHTILNVWGCCHIEKNCQIYGFNAKTKWHLWYLKPNGFRKVLNKISAGPAEILEGKLYNTATDPSRLNKHCCYPISPWRCLYNTVSADVYQLRWKADAWSYQIGSRVYISQHSLVLVALRMLGWAWKEWKDNLCPSSPALLSETATLRWMLTAQSSC
jgi:hypothetical protein